MAYERRFLTGARETSPSLDDDPGLIIKDDGTVAVVDATGAETLKVGVAGGEIFVLGLPTADPSVAGQLYTTAGALKVSAG